MNCYKFNAFFDKLYTFPKNCFSDQKIVYFHCISNGHYWRTSQINELSLLSKNENNKWIIQTWVVEQEKDEYELLMEFNDAIASFDVLIGFNSTSFHIPFLEAKFKSYDLPLIIHNKKHIDLLKEIKPIGKHLHISTKLQDLRIFFDIDEQVSEIESIAYFCNLFLYEDILNGDFFVDHIEEIDNSEYLITCSTNAEIPQGIRIKDDEFYFIGEKKSLKILLKTDNGYVRLYYSNYKDYYYLPEENIVLHKSLASTLPKDKRIKATKDNCYSIISFEDRLKNNPKYLHQYLVSLFHHYKEK